MLISDLILAVLPRVARQAETSGITIYQAANSIQSLIYKTLMVKKSDLQVTGDLDIQIPAFGYYATLPSDFVAFAEKPYSEELINNWMVGTVTSYDDETGALVFNATSSSGTDTLEDWEIAVAGVPGSPAYNVGSSSTSVTCGTGSKSFVTQAGLGISAGQYLIISGENSPSGWTGRTKILQPNYLNNDEDQWHDTQWWEGYAYYGEASEPPSDKPSYYKVIGSTLYVRPKVVININVKGRYFATPTPFTLSTQTIPWQGKFDEIFVEGVIRIINKGIAIPENDADFMLFFNRELIFVLEARARLIPKRHRIPYSAYM